MVNRKLVLPLDAGHVLLATPPQVPRVEYLDPFLEAARLVLEQELATEVQRGQLSVADGCHTTQEVTAIVGITGQVTGLAFYGMPGATALAIVERLLGQPVAELDDLALSGIAELGNVITGRAATLLAEVGLEAEIAPPVLLVGAGSRVSTAGIRRIVVPLLTELGALEAQLAIKGS
ncbi:MAG TPA: chemotaxis protein CheX [Chloroflexota bacterium]|nr:chemotaxis protein CheX [Chloroflexota bacterium]